MRGYGAPRGDRHGGGHAARTSTARSRGGHRRATSSPRSTAHGERHALRWKDGDGVGGSGPSPSTPTGSPGRPPGCRAMGVAPGDRIVLMMRNSPSSTCSTWPPSCAAPRRSRSTTRRRPSRSRTWPATAGRRSAVVEDDGFLARFTPVRDQLGDLKAIGMLRPDGADGAVAFDVAELLEHDPVDLEAAAASGGPDDLATVIYTSGTTGPPKGVMLTQLQRALDRRVPAHGDRLRGPRRASGSCRTCRWPTSPSG